MTLDDLLESVSRGQVCFGEVLNYIDEHYTYIPSPFTNGDLENSANENQGSARIFYFARENNWSKEQTLLLFCEHYAVVLASPEGESHQNIRQFMQHGWSGIRFAGEVLRERKR